MKRIFMMVVAFIALAATVFAMISSAIGGPPTFPTLAGTTVRTVLQRLGLMTVVTALSAATVGIFGLLTLGLFSEFKSDLTQHRRLRNDGSGAFENTERTMGDGDIDTTRHQDASDVMHAVPAAGTT